MISFKMKKIFLLIFGLLIISQKKVYSFEMKDCYFIHISSYSGQVASKDLDKNFDRNKFEYYIFLIDRNKKTLTMKYRLTDKEYKKRVDSWKKLLGEKVQDTIPLQKDVSNIFNLKYLDEKQAKSTYIESDIRNEIIINFKEKKVHREVQKQNGDFFSKEILQCL
jgi:hypothetical protein